MVRWMFALIAVGCVLADEIVEDRKSKLPYIADAVGNKIPPPSNGPAPIGSPSNLLTPDRYEFYTFDESGELVKRLMTLEEIQAIVAAGEGTEGHLVTFANDEQPNISFNFSQAPFNKVHNVVTNVQNVLKAQMEAQKNNPPTNTALDTPDVSDSWSLILPTIFGNTGAEIVPDKSSNSHTVPETDTLELDFDENSLSKEGDSHVLSSSPATSKYEETEMTTGKSKISSTVATGPSSESTPSTKPTTTTTTSTSITSKTPTTTTTTLKPKTNTTQRATTTTLRPRTTTTTTSTTMKPRITTKTTTLRPRFTTTTTTIKPRTTSSTTVSTTTSTPITSTTRKTLATTSTSKKRPSLATTTTSFSTTVKPTQPSTTTKSKLTTKPILVTTKPEYNKIESISLNKTNDTIETKFSTDNDTLNKDTSYVPVSTIQYVTTERIITKSPVLSKTTAFYVSTTKRSITTESIHPNSSPLSIGKETAITTYKPKISTPSPFMTTTSIQPEFDRIQNTTTITTQSVSPSTTISTTEYLLVENKPKPAVSETSNNQNDYTIPYFDIAQSISQIASELDDDQIPTKNNLDTTKSGGLELESKENVGMDINDSKNTETKTTVVPLDITTNFTKFVKISTLNPPLDDKKDNKTALIKDDLPIVTKVEQKVTEAAQTSVTTIDPILFESMDDLFSQIIEQNPPKIQTIEKNEQDSTTVSSDSVKKPIEVNKINTFINTTRSTSAPDTPIMSSESATEQINKFSSGSNESTTTKFSDITEHPLKDTKIKSENKIDEVTSTTTKKSAVTEQINKSSSGSNESTTTKFSDVTEHPLKDTKIKSENKIDEVTSTTTKKSAVTESIPLKNYNVETVKEQKEPIKMSPSTNPVATTLTDTVYQEMPEKVFSLLDDPFKKSNFSIKKSDNNKASNTADQNLLQDIQKTNKIPDLKPKIDDFKKKIQKVNIDDKELVNERNSSWKLISTVKPPNSNDIPKEKIKLENNYMPESEENKDINLDVSTENQGLAVTTKNLSEDISQFTELCNELAFRYWHLMTANIEKKRSFVLSPYSITSMLAMLFMGARGATSGEMNEILKLDDMVTFNPHFTLKNISDSIETTPEAGVVLSAFIRELYSDRNKGKILTFYKERAQHFYNGHVEEINFKLISDVIRRRTNLLVKRYTWGRISEYLKSNTITMQSPLAALSTNIFETDCTGTSVEGRDGEMYFVVSPTVRQRRLVPVPAVVYKKGFLAGYDPVLDATAAALGNTNSIISTVFLMPGQQGNVVHADDLEALERRLLDSNPTTEVWNRLLRTLLPRMGLELQIPRFSHKSVFNVSSTLKTMGLKELFDEESADLGGLNGPSKDLYLSDMIQLTTFATCGEGVIGEQHHIEEYPERLEPTRRRRTSRWASGWDEPRDYQRAFHDPHDVGDAMHLPLHLRPRQARLPSRNAQPARLKFDRPFLFFVRHNPSGMILYVGRYNPRLLP